MQRRKGTAAMEVHSIFITVLGLLCLSTGTSSSSRSCGRFTNERAEGSSCGTFVVPLRNDNDFQYSWDLHIGSPWQNFTAVFDTAARTWVLSENCHDELCRGRRKFHPRQSSTCKDTTVIGSTPFGNGTVEGLVSWDRQQVAGVTLPRLPILRIGDFQGSKQGHKGLSFNAVLGLEQWPGSFFGTLVHERALTRPWFSFYLSPDDKVKGEAVFGAANPEHYEEPLMFVPATGPYWSFHIDGIEMAEHGHYCFNGCVARPATADSYIGGPPNEIQRINTDIGAMKVDSGEWMVNCERIRRLHDIKFSINNRIFILKPEDYLVQRDTPNGKRCYSGFIEVVEKGGVTWHLGHVFLRRVYTVLEWPSSGSSEFGQIGLAYSR